MADKSNDIQTVNMDIDDYKTSPCLGSGYCCHKVACHEGIVAHKDYTHGPCPSLRWTGTRHMCGLILDADKVEAARLKKSLSIGAGCCAPLFNNWRTELKNRT
mgnify:FL=1